MIDIPAASLPLSAAGGLAIGLLYFGGLWWTVRRMASARHPAALVAGSFLVRAAVAAGGIVLISGGKLVLLAAAMAGFLIGRTILILIIGKSLPENVAGAGAVPGYGAGITHRPAARKD